jgi:hypothetical protein
VTPKTRDRTSAGASRCTRLNPEMRATLALAPASMNSANTGVSSDIALIEPNAPPPAARAAASGTARRV